MATRLTLQWRILDGDEVALVFDKSTWATFDIEAQALGIDTGEMIIRALAELLGPIERLKRTSFGDDQS